MRARLSRRSTLIPSHTQPCYASTSAGIEYAPPESLIEHLCVQCEHAVGPCSHRDESIIAHEDANVASMDTQVRTRAFASCVELSQTHPKNGLFARPREHFYQQGHLATHFCLLRMALNSSVS